MKVEGGSSFGNQLRRLRQLAGLSQEELAERAGLTAAAIGALERGERRHPYPQTLQLLADALGLSSADRAEFFISVPKRGSSDEHGAGGGTRAEPDRQSPLSLPLTPLVGRERDIAIVTGLFRHGRARMVTLTGPGGVGKTRLAIEIAGALRSSFEMGPVWVDLASIRDQDLVLSAIARALGLAERSGQDMAETLESYLGRRQSLLVLDNFEHLLSAAPSVSALLERCPRLSVLATSREALRVRGEFEIQVPPLGLPNLEIVASADSVARSEAADLFLQRVRAVRPGFELTDTDAPTIAAICAQLDGIPLALELAAVQLKYMSPTVLLDRLSSRLVVLEGGPRDLPTRQQSLRATVAWSHDLLTSPEQDLFRRLAIFDGGFSMEVVEAVCNVEEISPTDTSRTLAALVDKSVVQAVPDSSGEVRFAMLETIREYARERLVESGEECLLADRHADYFCELSEAAEPNLTSASRDHWLRQLDVEAANLRAALAWTTSGGDQSIGLRLGGALGWFWLLRGYISEGTNWAELLLSRSIESDAGATRAYLLGLAAGLAWKREDYPLASRYAKESVAGLRTLGSSRRLALALSGAGLIATSLGNLVQARQSQEECLSLFRELDDRWGIAYALANLGDVFLHGGDLAEARRRYAESLEQFERVGDPWGRGIVHHTLGNVAWAQGDIASARAHYAASVALTRNVKNDDTGRGLIGLAAVALSEGETDEAYRLLTEGLLFWRDFGSRAGVAVCLSGLAGVQSLRGQFRAAARLFGAAQAQGRGHASLYVVDANTFSSYLEETRRHLDEESFALAWDEGLAMTVEQAFEYAFQEDLES